MIDGEGHHRDDYRQGLAGGRSPRMALRGDSVVPMRRGAGRVVVPVLCNRDAAGQVPGRPLMVVLEREM